VAVGSQPGRFNAGHANCSTIQTDQKSWDELDALVLREAKAGHREEVWVTVVGLFQAPQAYILEDGHVVGGYGHIAVFPAELVVERVLGTIIRRTRTYDYRELLRHNAAKPN
jgi:hypothetical protein